MEEVRTTYYGHCECNASLDRLVQIEPTVSSISLANNGSLDKPR